MADEKTLTNEELFKMYSDWSLLSMHQTLTEDFIREFKDKVDWDVICTSQKLSESFIREFKDLVKWDKIHVSKIIRIIYF